MHDLWERIVMEKVGLILEVHQENCELPLWEKEIILKEVVTFDPLGPSNKSVD